MMEYINEPCVPANAGLIFCVLQPLPQLIGFFQCWMTSDGTRFADAADEDMAKVFDVEVAQDHTVLQENGIE